MRRLAGYTAALTATLALAGSAAATDVCACGNTGGAWVEVMPCTYIPTWGGSYMQVYHPSYGYAYWRC